MFEFKFQNTLSIMISNSKQKYDNWCAKTWQFLAHKITHCLHIHQFTCARFKSHYGKMFKQPMIKQMIKQPPCELRHLGQTDKSLGMANLS